MKDICMGKQNFSRPYSFFRLLKFDVHIQKVRNECRNN